MGGGGTTTSQGTIDPTLQPLYRGSSNQLLNYMQQNPMTGYATPNPRGTAGLSPYESAGLQAMGGLFNASPWEALAAQSIMAAPGVARQGPTTGQYGYGGLQDMQSIYNMLGGGNPLQQRVGPGGGYGSPAPPSGPPVAPPQPPPTGGPPGGGGNPGPGGPGNPPVAQGMGMMVPDSAFPSVTPNGQGGYEVSQSMTPPPGGNGMVNAQALRNFVVRSWEADQRRQMEAGRRGPGADLSQFGTQPFTGFDQYGIARSQGLGAHETQGLGFMDPTTGNYMTRRGDMPDEGYINSQMQSLLASQGRSMADLDQTTRARDAMPAAAPAMTAEEAARLNAGYSRNFSQIQAAQAAAAPPAPSAGASATSPATNQHTGQAAGGAAAPSNAAADQARILRRGQPVTVTRR